MNPTRVRIFYPADPLGVVPGGIDTFIRGIVKWAPPELKFSLVGMTTDPAARPQGRWTKGYLGEREFDFFPVVTVHDAGSRSRIPLSVRFTAGAWRYRAALTADFDVFEFHRMEPSLLYRGDARPKNAFFHQDPQSLRLEASDNLWRRLPAFYERLEEYAMNGISTAWCVRESGVQVLKERYPAHAGHIRFVPTWVDSEVFFPAGETARAALRGRLADEFALDRDAQWIVSVGRLDTQKNPALLIAAFAAQCAGGARAELVLVGDGVLRPRLVQLAQQAGIADRVHFLGLRPQAKIAELLRAGDLFALSSAYEGMPMALLEAYGCGMPAVVTDVGEVRRVVETGVNGMIAASHSEADFAAALQAGLADAARWHGAIALAAVKDYQPASVLAPVYQNYLALARGGQSPAAMRAATVQRTGSDKAREAA